MAKQGSARFELDLIDLKKIGKGAVIALLGASLTYGTTYFTNVNYGDLTPVWVAIWSIVANMGWKWISDHQDQ
jgi:hypothetical protein